MACYKRVVAGYAKYFYLLAMLLTLVILAFSFCSQAPENCGDGQTLDARSEFCFEGKAYKKCGGSEYDPTAQFCSAEAVYNKCGGRDSYDPVREFCAGGKILGKCGGGDTYNPDTQGCVFGLIKPRCGNGFYDPANEFCHNNSKVYEKCDGQAFDPALGCGGVAAEPECGGAGGDTTKPCYGGKTYPTCGGAVYDPSMSICEGRTVVNKTDSITPPVVDTTGNRGPFSVTVISVAADAFGSGVYDSGKTVTIDAGTVPFGQQFKNWTTGSAGVKFSSANAKLATFPMPANNVTVTANFEARKYAVTISTAGADALGAGSYPAGDTVVISAGTAPAGYAFRNWTTTNKNVTLANATAQLTRFVMPASAVKLTASFTGTFKDTRNNKTYNTVKIGTYTWMAENLNYQQSAEIGKSWCYGEKADSCAKYGRLYNWAAATKVCPSGWHLPTKEEWRTSLFLGDSATLGKALKSKTGWYNSGNGTDDYGFNAKPGGSAYCSGGCTSEGAGLCGNWWTATKENSEIYYQILRYDGNVSWYGLLKDNVSNSYEGMSVRCFQDN